MKIKDAWIPYCCMLLLLPIVVFLLIASHNKPKTEWKRFVRKAESEGWTKKEVLGETGEYQAVLSCEGGGNKGGTVEAGWITDGVPHEKTYSNAFIKLLIFYKNETDSFVIAFEKDQE